MITGDTSHIDPGFLNRTTGSGSNTVSNSTPWGITQLGAQSEIDFPTIVGDATGNDICNDVTTDASGNIYCAGSTKYRTNEHPFCKTQKVPLFPYWNLWPSINEYIVKYFAN